MGKTPEKDLDARNVVLDLQDVLREKLVVAERAADELYSKVPLPRHDPGEVARRPENPVSAVLHEMNDLLTDFCERLLEQLNNGATCNPQVPMGDEEVSLRQQISVMARHFDHLSERQQEYVRVIKNLKRMHDDEVALHKQEAVYWKREAVEARSVREQEVKHLRELRARDLKEAREHIRALEEVHRAAEDDLVHLCSRSVASIADSALEVLVAGQQLKLETPEMADIVYNALQNDINEKLEAWTSQYCGARASSLASRHSSSAGLQSCLRKQSSLSMSSNSSISSAGSGDTSPPGTAGLPRPITMPRSLLSTAPINLPKAGSRSSSVSSEILPASPAKSRPLTHTSSRSMMRARFEYEPDGKPAAASKAAMQAMPEGGLLPRVASIGSRSRLRARFDSSIASGG